MASRTIVRTAARKADERNFIVSGHAAWVCRLIAEGTEQMVGVRLKVLRPFTSSPLSYFINEDGGSFRQVSNAIDSHGIGIEMSVGEAEANPEMLNTLRQALAIWKSASGLTERRSVIRERCIRLGKLLGSLSQTHVSAHLQDVRTIQEQSQSAPDDKVQDVEEELLALERRLVAADAEDGEKILSPKRHQKFLSNPDL